MNHEAQTAVKPNDKKRRSFAVRSQPNLYPPRIFKIHILMPKHWYILDNCKLNSFGATAFLALRSGSCSGASPAALCAGNASTQHFVSWANSVHLHHICGYCGRFGHFGHWSLVIAANRGNCEDCPPHVDFLLKNHEIYTHQPISQSVLPRHPCKQMTSQMTPVYGSRWGYPGTNQTTKSPILFMCNIKYCIKPSHVDLVVPIVDPFPDSPHVFIAHTYDYW